MNLLEDVDPAHLNLTKHAVRIDCRLCRLVQFCFDDHRESWYS